MLKPFKGNLCSKYATKMLSIKINNRCNMRCSFCVDRDGRDGKTINVKEMANKAIEECDYKEVIITGGEPFLNFEEVIQLATELRPHKSRIVLNTNGSLLTESKVVRLNGIIDELQVSIHHYEEDKNDLVFGSHISLKKIKQSLINKEFTLSINSTFNKSFSVDERPTAVSKMVDICNWIGADNLRLTELKKVGNEQFVDAKLFYDKDHIAVIKDSNSLIETGCTCYYKDKGVRVSVKRLCEYAKGDSAESFSCCFIDINGQKKIDVDTVNTFKVIYSDGLVCNDWIFNKGIK